MSSVDNDGRYAPPRAAVDDVPEATDGLVLGGRGPRLLATSIDVILSLAAVFLASAVTPWAPFAQTRDYFSFSLLDPAMGFVVFLLLNGYLLATQGRTIGKRLIGLRIVRSDGSPVSFGRLIGLRTACSACSMCCRRSASSWASSIRCASFARRADACTTSLPTPL